MTKQVLIVTALNVFTLFNLGYTKSSGINEFYGFPTFFYFYGVEGGIPMLEFDALMLLISVSPSMLSMLYIGYILGRFKELKQNLKNQPKGKQPKGSDAKSKDF